MFEVGTLSGFSPNCQKITWGHHGGAFNAPNALMMGGIMGDV